MSDSDGEGATHEATTAPTETSEISEAASAYAAVRPEVEAATALLMREFPRSGADRNEQENRPAVL